jgi:DNA polymerase III epsilon subunit-like protein
MPINNNYYCVIDFETSGVPAETCTPLELAAKIYDPRSLEPVGGNGTGFDTSEGEFCTLMRPKDNEWANFQEGAMKLHKIPVDELKMAPEREVAWKAFVEFVKKWRKNSNKLSFPIVAGKNIRNFDLVIMDRLAQELGPWDAKENCPAIFHPRLNVDLEDFLFGWYENQAEPAKVNMDAIREHFGIKSEHKHRALVDVREEGDLIVRFLKMQRTMFRYCKGLKGVKGGTD